MLLQSASQTSFIKTVLFIIFASISFSAAAGHHGNAEHKAKKMMDKSHATDKAAMKSTVADKDKEAAKEAKAKMDSKVDAEEVEVEVEVEMEMEETPAADDSDG